MREGLCDPRCQHRDPGTSWDTLAASVTDATTSRYCSGPRTTNSEAFRGHTESRKECQGGGKQWGRVGPGVSWRVTDALPTGISTRAFTAVLPTPLCLPAPVGQEHCLPRWQAGCRRLVLQWLPSSLPHHTEPIFTGAHSTTPSPPRNVTAPKERAPRV